MLQRQPSRSILDRYQRESGVGWLAVDHRTVAEVLRLLVEMGVTFTRGMALMDLHHAIRERAVESYRYYAERWRWSTKRAYTLFVEVGIYGSVDETDGAQVRSGGRTEKRAFRSASGADTKQTGSSGGARREQAGGEPRGKRAVREQQGAGRERSGATGEPPSLSQSGSTSRSGKGDERQRGRGAGGRPSGAGGGSTGGSASRNAGGRNAARTPDDVARALERSERLLDDLFGDRRDDGA